MRFPFYFPHTFSDTADLKYVGPPPANSNDLVDDDYVVALLAENFTESQVTTYIANSLAHSIPPYLTQTAYTSGVAGNATKSFVDSGDATRLKVAQIGVNSGIAGLTAAGTVDIARITTPSTQTYPRPFTSPSAYNSGIVTATATPSTLFPISVSDPGVPYKLWVSGLLDGQTGTDGQFPVVLVRVGSTSGPIVASGAGLGEVYQAGVISSFSGVGNGVYQIPTWAYSVDVIALGGGGGGNGSLYIQSFGGFAGSWATTTYTRGSSTSGTVFGPEVHTLLYTVGGGGVGGGAGGGAGGNGVATTVSYPGMTSVVAAGGKGGGQIATFNPQGQGVTAETYNGNTFPGGAVQPTGGAGGNAPGGGGASGVFGSVSPGGAGAPGAVFFFASPSSPSPSGPITIMPTPMNAQTSLTGAKTLYVMLVSSGSGTVSASTFKPGLMVIPVPTS